MKILPWILVALLAVVCVGVWFCPRKLRSLEVGQDTVVVVDTVRDTVLEPYRVCIIDTLTLYMPLLTDGGEEDSVPVALPIERKEYKTNEYHAIISGFHPHLDFMETYNKIQTITSKPKRWGFGLQAGYGYPDGGYVGVGISYNLLQW